MSSASIQIGIAVQNSVHCENKEYTEVKFLTKKINFRVYFVTYDKLQTPGSSITACTVKKK